MIRKQANFIHQFNVRGLSFTTGSGRKLEVKEHFELFVYNGVVRLKQSEVYKIRQKFRSFFLFYCLYGICYQETAFLKALAYGMLGQTIDTSALTLSTAFVLGSCSCFACNIIVMGLDFIVESLRSISCQRPRGLNVSGCKGELIARVFAARNSSVLQEIQQEIALGLPQRTHDRK